MSSSKRVKYFEQLRAKTQQNSPSLIWRAGLKTSKTLKNSHRFKKNKKLVSIPPQPSEISIPKPEPKPKPKPVQKSVAHPTLYDKHIDQIRDHIYAFRKGGNDHLRFLSAIKSTKLIIVGSPVGCEVPDTICRWIKS